MPLLTLGVELTVSVTLLSLLSGIGSYFHGRRTERLKRGWIDFLAEVTLALVVGLVVTYLCEAAEADRLITMALVLILSNNGAESCHVLREGALKRLSLIFNGGEK